MRREIRMNVAIAFSYVLGVLIGLIIVIGVSSFDNTSIIDVGADLIIASLAGVFAMVIISFYYVFDKFKSQYKQDYTVEK